MDRHEQGRPDHHDPTSGIGGAPKALDALTLRLGPAAIGVVGGTAGALLLVRASAPAGGVVALALVAAVATVNLVVVARRKARREPG